MYMLYKQMLALLCSAMRVHDFQDILIWKWTNHLSLVF